MAIINYYTRQEWEDSGGWPAVQDYAKGVVLLFREEDDPGADILPICQRVDPATRKIWPEDVCELPDVPFRYYERDEECSTRWELLDEGADKTPHTRLYLPRS